MSVHCIGTVLRVSWLIVMLSQLVLHDTHVAAQELMLANVVFRHGDRSPVMAYPSDPYQEDFWPQGFGQLSKRGMRQEYALGKYLRQRYDHFINLSYIREEVFMRSTDVDRTIMSAESVLAAMFPPGEEQEWKPDLDWQPIPVHTVPVDSDALLRTVDCPVWLEHINHTMYSPQVIKEVQEKFQDLVYDIRNKTGWEDWDDSVNSTLLHLSRTRDALFCENEHNLTLPGWATEHHVLERTTELMSYFARYTMSGLAKRRLTGGLLVGELVDHMLLKADPILAQSTKLYMYSGHDTTVLMLLNALDVYDNIYIPYSTAVFVELWNSTDQGNYVQIWLRNDTTREPVQLTLPGCTPNCPLLQFVNLTRPVIPDQFWSECNGFFTFSFKKLSLVLLISVGVGLVIMVLSALCMVFVCGRCYGRRPIRVYTKPTSDHLEHVPMINAADESDLDE